MKTKILIIIGLFFLISCHYSTNYPIDKRLLKILDQYSKRYNKKTNPFSYSASSYDTLKKYKPFPSYNIFFEKEINDTIVYIGYLPYFNRISPRIYKINDSIEELRMVNADGWILYKGKVFIFFNSKLYKNIDKSQLNNYIPDSLKFDFSKRKIEIGYKPHFTKYKIENGKFIKIG